jgi:hypothetical protein
MIVHHYGVHWADEIAFLLQGTGTSNLFSPDLECPFTVETRPRRTPCPHNINLEEWVETPNWLSDPLAQMFVPVPNPGVKLIYDPGNKLDKVVTDLQRLCSPIHSIVRPVWWKEAIPLAKHYGITNLSPLVWARANPYTFPQVLRHINLAQFTGGKALIICEERIPIFDVEWITTELTDVSNEPLERIGAGALRKYMDEAQN